MAVGKGRCEIKGGVAAHNEVEVINGALKVIFVTRTIPTIAPSGYGAAQISGGRASKGEAEVINGALKVRSS